jgi:putative Mg2+ transporter-C (MgtC) family protein
MDAAELDGILRLIAAAAVGIAVGFNRDLRGKPLGMRTLALVSLGAALASITAINFADLAAHPDALSRVVQGAVQGVLTGIGFIGAGVVLHDRDSMTVHGLTTAATVWVTAALGIACALAAWMLALTAVVLTLVILFGLGWVEQRLMSKR